MCLEFFNDNCNSEMSIMKEDGEKIMTVTFKE